jgi:phage-related minor tail protein
MNGIIAWLSKLPIAQYIKPLWKSAAKALLSNEIEQLRPQVKALAAKGPAAVDAAFQQLDARIDSGIQNLPLPGVVKAALLQADGALDAQLDHVRQLIDAALADQASGALDAALDSGKAALLARIDAL